MSRVVETTVYEYHELSEDAKEYARQDYRESRFHNDDHWWDHVLEDAQRTAAVLGIEIRDSVFKTHDGGQGKAPAIYFDLESRSCTFDGRYKYKPDAVIQIQAECNDEVLHALAVNLTVAQIQAKLTTGTTWHVDIHGNAGLKFSMDVEPDNEDYEGVGTGELAFIDPLTRFAVWIRKNLEAERDYQDSDEFIDQELEAQDWEFDEDGRKI